MRGPSGSSGSLAWHQLRLVARRAFGGQGTEDDDPDRYLQSALGYVDVMFSGGKAHLRPVYDELLRLGLSIGPDILYRNHVFAQIKPTANTRTDLGFALKDTPSPAV
jgi:hypothetical protein